MSIAETIKQLKPKLVEYLQDQFGVVTNASGKFACIDPGHKDDTPSMHFMHGGQEHAYCFGCHAKYDIFEAAHLAEGLPIQGQEFYTKTVPEIAERYGIYCPTVQVSSEAAHRSYLRKCARKVFELLITLGDFEPAKERGLDETICEEFGVARIPSYNEFVRILNLRQVSEEALQILDIKPSVFGKDRLTFTLFNEKGSPVAFAARYLDYRKLTEEEKQKGTYMPSKYDSTRNSPIYNKSHFLYGFHKVRTNKPTSVMVCEGYFDVLAAHQAGAENTVGICGTALTPGHYTMLESIGIKEALLCLDKDTAGQKATLKLISENIDQHSKFRLGTYQLPEGIKDPDEAFLTYGADTMSKLVAKTAFQYWLENVWQQNVPTSEEEKIELTESAVKIISTEPSPIRRVGMIKFLSDLSGFSPRVLGQQVDSVLFSQSEEFKRRIRRISSNVTKKLRTPDAPVMSILSEATREAEQIWNTYLQDSSVDPKQRMLDTLDKLADVKEKFDKHYFIKTGYKLYDDTFGGLPAKGFMIPLMARPSSGKSSLLAQLVPSIINANEDVVIRYHTVDDPLETAMLRIACAIGQVNSDNLRAGSLSEAEQQRYHQGRKAMESWIKSGLLEIRDAEMGYTLDYATQWLRLTKEEFPDRKVLYILDNLYKTWKDSSDIRARVETAANELQIGICQSLGVCGLCTVEPKRVNADFRTRLTIDDAKETGKIEQNAHVFWILHNGAPPNRPSEIPDSRGREWHCVEEQRHWPMAEVEVVKNKDMGPGLWRLFYHPAEYTFREESCLKGNPSEVDNAFGSAIVDDDGDSTWR